MKNKINKIEYTKTEMVDAEIINEFKVSLECGTPHTSTVGSHTQIIAEIVNIQAEEEFLNEKGKVDLKLLNPIVYNDV